MNLEQKLDIIKKIHIRMGQPVNMKLLKGVLHIYCILVKGVKGVRYLKTPNMKTKGTS